MPEELETILRLVRDGHLSPEEAAPIIDALTRRTRQPASEPDAPENLRETIRSHARGVRGPARAIGQSLRGSRQVRIRVTERGRQVVNLRIPLPFADAALRAVPGLGADQASRIREALDAGTIGPIVDVEDSDGSGVLISVE